MHTYILGETGSGKSMAQVRRILGSKRAVVLDWHFRSLAWESAKHIASQGRRFILDNLGWTKHGISWRFIAPTKKKGPTGRKTNEARARAFSEILMRYQGRASLTNTPLIEAATMAALMCYLHQKKPFPLHRLYRLFDPNDPLHARAVANCTDDETRRILSSWKNLSKSARRYELGGAERMFRTVLTSSAFELRCNGHFDIARFLQHEDGGHVLIEGGDVSEEARRVLFGAISQQVIREAKRGKFKEPVHLLLDEAQEFIGGYEAKALHEVRKFNLEITIISQSLIEGIREDILQNCQRIEVYRCNSPETARLFGGMIAAVLRSDASASDVQREIMNLKRGERYVREGNAWKEYVPLLKAPYPWPGLTEKRTWEAIRKAIGEHGEKLSPSGSEKTPAPRSRPAEPSSTSTPNSPSPAIKLLREMSAD